VADWWQLFISPGPYSSTHTRRPIRELFSLLGVHSTGGGVLACRVLPLTCRSSTVLFVFSLAGRLTTSIDVFWEVSSPLRCSRPIYSRSGDVCPDTHCFVLLEIEPHLRSFGVLYYSQTWSAFTIGFKSTSLPIITRLYTNGGESHTRALARSIRSSELLLSSLDSPPDFRPGFFGNGSLLRSVIDSVDSPIILDDSSQPRSRPMIP